MINASNIIPVKTASCSVMGDYAIKRKMNVPWGKHKVGDIVLFDFNKNGTSDHVGIVEKINKNGTITAIEGNTSVKSNDNGGNVMRRTRYKSQVNYFVRPKYDKKVTAKMLIDTAISQLGTKEKPPGSNKVKYNTWYYGKEVKGSAYPWCMTFIQWLFAHVKEPKKATSTKTESATKAKGTYTGTIPKPTLKKGSKGDKVKQLQKFYEWYFPNVKFKNYGTFGEHTEKVQKRFQKAQGLKQTGVYGESSYKKASAYKHKSKTPKADKLVAKMKELAWAYGTEKSKYDYDTGKPKDVCKKALKKYGWADNKAEMSDCGNNVSAAVREAGIDKSFKALRGVKTPFSKTEKAFNIVLKGKKIPKGFLKPGDIIRYKKKNGNQHAMFYYGDGKICEASHYNRFFVILKDTQKYNEVSKVKTIQVLRVKE